MLPDPAGIKRAPTWYIYDHQLDRHPTEQPRPTHITEVLKFNQTVDLQYYEGRAKGSVTNRLPHVALK